MKKLEKMALDLNDGLGVRLAEEMLAKFGVETETTFDFLGSMRMVTRRIDDADFTPEEFAHLEAWANGYGKALDVVRSAAGVER